MQALIVTLVFTCLCRSLCKQQSERAHQPGGKWGGRFVWAVGTAAGWRAHVRPVPSDRQRGQHHHSQVCLHCVVRRAQVRNFDANFFHRTSV
jgi:hypothetical protein